MTVLEILEEVKCGRMAPADAAARLDPSGRMALGFADVDTGRAARRGFPEVIYAPGKTTAQIVAICRALNAAGQNAMASRIDAGQAVAVQAEIPAARYHAGARILTSDCAPLPEPRGLVAVVSAGTTDIPVAEEAALTAERMGARVERRFDIGVAGLHRLFAHLEMLRSARVTVVVAGMEGALPSVVGGLIDRPLIAVPTSVGYGVGARGRAALEAMLTSCVPGITVVNIDNGFGAGVAAAMINRAAGGRESAQ